MSIFLSAKAFREDQTFSTGKDLTLLHTILNFNDPLREPF